MQRLIRWASLAALALGIVVCRPSAAENMAEDPQAAIEEQFAAITPITATSSPAEAAQWLDAVGEVMGRVALGGLAQLPKNASAAVDTVANIVVHTDALLQDRVVLRKVLELTPSIWTTGYWYAPLATWKPAFEAIWTKSVAFAKRARDSVAATDSEPFDAAVNATSLMIRFTKDTYFINGDRDTGAASDSALASAREYMGFLPEVVAALSCAPSFTLSEQDLRAYMNKLPSKRDGMDMSAPFPTFVDTARFRDSDATALRAFIAASGAPAHQL